MAHINRRFIDKHWMVFILRGLMAAGFGLFTLFGSMADFEVMISVIAIFLLLMGIVDSVSALYASVKKHGWINSVIDALIDIAAALALLFFARQDIVVGLVIIGVYTIVSGLIDIFHGFLSTVDPTDRFIRVLAGVLGCIMGVVIFNAGEFEITTFVRFFGAYVLIVGVTSLIYGVHNRSQDAEDRVARSQAAKKLAKVAAKKKIVKNTAKSKKNTTKKKK
ncbi:DUF308 domain-containing protein [Candidatus Saccharibacteria bacterium]|nr:DUF308 domain-containing protein [Candidatus Saccharibacteria bacterium]